MKGLALACVFIWLCMLSMIGPMRLEAEICIANEKHVSHTFLPMYSLIHPQWVFEWFRKGGGICPWRARWWGLILLLQTCTLNPGLYSHRCLSAINTNGNQRRVDLEHMSVTQVMFYLSCFLGFAQISILILCNCQNQQAEHNQHGETRRI